MKRFLLYVIMLTLTVSTFADEVWTGYYSGGTRTCIGYAEKETYDQASWFGGPYEGNSLKAVRIYLGSKKFFKDLKIWVSRELPADASKADIMCMDVKNSDIEGGDEDTYNNGIANDITLPSPIDIPEGGVYVGYSLTVTATYLNDGRYPVMYDDKVRTERGFYLKTSQSDPSWTCRSQTWGSLAMQLLLEGDIPEYKVQLTGFDDVVVSKDAPGYAKLDVLNLGTGKITDLDIIISTEGEADETVHQDFALAGCGVNSSLEVQLNPSQPQTIVKRNIRVAKINGQEAVSNAVSGNLATIAQPYPRRILVEEMTGTNCGFCPRGWQGMENLREAYPNDVIGIAVHQYNSTDPMYIEKSEYAPVNFYAAPSCKVNRGPEIDPYYGDDRDEDNIIPMSQVIDEALARIPECDVEVSGSWNADKTAVDATARVQSCLDDKTYHIEYVLVADGLTGSTKAWAQANYYSEDPYSPEEGGEDMRKFCKGEEWGQSYIKNFVYNDVAIASTYTSGVNTIDDIYMGKAYTDVENHATIDMPTSATLLDAVNYDEVFVVAIIVNNSGDVLNAAKARIGATSDIVTIQADHKTTDTTVYNILGQRVQHNTKGLLISNGKKRIVSIH